MAAAHGSIPARTSDECCAVMAVHVSVTAVGADIRGELKLCGGQTGTHRRSSHVQIQQLQLMIHLNSAALIPAEKRPEAFTDPQLVMMPLPFKVWTRHRISHLFNMIRLMFPQKTTQAE